MNSTCANYAQVADDGKFPSDIRYLLKFIKNTKDKEALRSLMEQAKQEHVEKDTFLAILRYVDEPEDNIKPVYETVKANPNDNVDELVEKLKKLTGLEG